MSEALSSLQKYLNKMEKFNHVNTLLYWDMRTNTPKEGFAGHSDALTYFSTEQFAMSTSDELKGLLDTLAEPEEFEQLDDKWKFVVTKMKTDMDRNRRIPKAFYESFVKAQSESENAWEEAKEKAKEERKTAETPAEGKSRSIDSVSKQKAEKAVPKEKSSDVSEGREKTKEKDSGDDKNSKDKKKNKEKKQKDGKKPKKESSLKKIKSKIKSLKETKVNLDKMPWREWLELGKDVLIHFLKHALPGKLEGNIAFGTGNPEYTGYITGIAAVFYPKYGEHFSLYPDFERKMFEAKCRGRGRIRLGYMLVLAVSILKEKSVRTMIKNIILG